MHREGSDDVRGVGGIAGRGGGLTAWTDGSLELVVSGHLNPLKGHY